EMHLASLVDVMSPADEIVLAASSWIAEIETTISRVERQVIRTEQWLSLEFLGGMFEGLAVGGEMEHRVMAGVADEVGAVPRNLMTVRLARFGPDGVLAVERKLGDRLPPRDIAVPRMVEDHSFAISW